MKLYTATRILKAQQEYLQDKRYLSGVSAEQLKEATEVVMEIVHFLNLHGVSGLFSAKDMQNFAAKCLILGAKGKTTDELLKDFCENDR